MTFANLFEQKSKYTARRQRLRQNSTKSEQVLWYELRGKKLGYIFRRQFSIDKFIVDFCCVALRLIIELDGPIHEKQKSYDAYRESILRERKYKILRFKNDEVLFGRDRVMAEIKAMCQALERNHILASVTNPTLPSPTRGGDYCSQYV